MRYLIILILFLYSYEVKSQQHLNSEIKTNISEIFKFLKKNNEIDSTKNLNESKEIIYSREIRSFNNRKIIFFEIGITSLHSKKFISILDNKKFTILPTENFDEDFSSLLSHINSLKEKIGIEEFVNFLNDLKYVYESNDKKNEAFPKTIKQ